MSSGEEQDTSKTGRIALAAVDPKTGSTIEVIISLRRMHSVAKRGLGQAKECGFLVPHTLQHPTAIFEGLRLDEDEDLRVPGWYCYCSKPPCSFDENGGEQPPYPNEVFLVFVNQERVAYNWRWAKCDENDGKLPVNHETRFTKRAL